MQHSRSSSGGGEGKLGVKKEIIGREAQKSKSYLSNDKKKTSSAHGMSAETRQQQQQRRVDAHNARNIPALPHGGGSPRRDSKHKLHQGSATGSSSSGGPRPSDTSQRRSDVSSRTSAQESVHARSRPDTKKDPPPSVARPSTYYSPERRKSESARPRQLPQPGEAPRRKSAAARVTGAYRGPSLPSSQGPGSNSGSGRSPNRSTVVQDISESRNQMRKDSSPGRMARADLSPSRRSDDGEEYRTPPDRSPNLSRQKDFLNADRSPTTYYHSDKSPNREDVYRTPPDRSPNRSSAYHRSPVDGSPRSPREGGGEGGHRREGSDGLHRRKDSSPGRSATTATTDSKEPATASAMTLHPNDQPTYGRRRSSSSGQRLERQAAIVRERIEMHPDEIKLGSESLTQGTNAFYYILC